MHFAIYDPQTGVIRVGVNGPSSMWAEDFVASEYSGAAVLPVGHEVDNATERVDVAVDPPALVQLVKTPEQIKAEILATAQSRLDEFAQTRGYDSVLSAATYAGSAIEQFATEGQRAADLRDETWATLYRMLAEVLAGTRSMPASYADIEGELPTLAW